MQQIQLTNDQAKELEAMTRPITPAEETALNQAYAELDKKGFVMNGENVMILLRAYQAAPQVPITVQNVLDFTNKFREAFQWLSAEEVEFRKLSDQLGPATTQLVIRELGRHALVNTEGSEGLFTNFSSVVRFFQSQGWPIKAESFELAIGNLRTSLGHGTLIYRQTPSQLAQQKRWDDTRASESKKSLLEVAKEKAASVHHVFNPDGTRMSDTVMREFFEAHPEASEPETPAQTPSPVSSDDAYWQRQTQDYIRSLSGNLLQQEAEQSFGHPVQGSWRMSYANLRSWHEKKKSGPGHWY